MSWEMVMGIEVHAELSTNSKIFCGCTTKFGGQPNTHVCPVCAGMPGVLPRLNHSVVEYAMRLGLTLGSEITNHCKFDRKNYFYPDLPKAYQVSQLYLPICRGGSLEIEVDGYKKEIGLCEIHMEEDSGKLIHGEQTGNTFMDFNRCGVPLLEIVSQPDFSSVNEAIAYLEKLREILLYLDVCDCKMQEGSMRADVNISVRREGEALGVRTEMKNLNSFKAISRAIEYEAKRQIEVLETGGQIVQETRRWDDVMGNSVAMRSKENAQDYRYFPEPDLLPLDIDDAWIARVKDSIPELAHQKRERYVCDYAITTADAEILTRHKNISDLFEAVAQQSGKPAEAAHLVLGEILRLMNNHNILAEELVVDKDKMVTLITLLSEGKINRASYKQTIEAVFERDVDPHAYITEKGLMMQSDDGVIKETVAAVLAANEEAIADYRAGKDRAFGFLVGQSMKILGKGGNPNMVKQVLEEMLK